MKITHWIRSHQTQSYFVLVFVISWSAVLAVILPTTGFPAPPEAFSTQGGPFAASIFALLIGPPLAGLVMTRVFGGRSGLRDLRTRLTRVHVSASDYAMILIAPLSLLVVLVPLSFFDRAYMPGVLSASAPALAAGFTYSVAAGFFEELGWTGFATPRLIERHGVVRAGLLLGAVWALWHVLPVYAFSASTVGKLYWPNLAQSFVFLTSFRVLMTLVYARTGSLFISMLLHFSLTFSSILVAPSTTPEQMMLWNSLWPLALALVAIVMVGGYNKMGSRVRPLRRG